MQGLELQRIVKPRIKPTSKGKSLMFGFNIGPISVFIIVGVPSEADPTPLAYVKMSLELGKESKEWEFYKHHTESIPRNNSQ